MTGLIAVLFRRQELVADLALEFVFDGSDRDRNVLSFPTRRSSDLSYTGNWELITDIKDIPTFAARLQTQTFLFRNEIGRTSDCTPVTHTPRPRSCGFKIAEVEPLGGVPSAFGPPTITSPPQTQQSL